MLKRKLRANIDHLLTAKRKAEESKLDILFTAETLKPTNAQECFKYIRGLVDWRKFCEKIPPVVLQGQLYSLLKDHTEIDGQVSSLRCQSKIVVIKLDTGTYGIVDKEEYLNTAQKQIELQELEKDAGEEFINFCTQDELDVEMSSKHLLEGLRGHVDTLIRAGYLTSEVTGMYHLTIPNASLFLRTLNDGLKAVKAVIKKSKFKEILLTELLKKEGKKTNKLGMVYYVLHLVGTEVVKLVSTTSGPLLRYIEED